MPEDRSTSYLVWLGLAPPRVETFCWLAISGKVSTADNLKRGMSSENISDLRFCCGKERDN